MYIVISDGRYLVMWCLFSDWQDMPLPPQSREQWVPDLFIHTAASASGLHPNTEGTLLCWLIILAATQTARLVGLTLGQRWADRRDVGPTKLAIWVVFSIRDRILDAAPWIYLCCCIQYTHCLNVAIHKFESRAVWPGIILGMGSMRDDVIVHEWYLLLFRQPSP